MGEHGIVIVGAGVTGVALARALALAGERSITVVDKEGGVARHASGHNSGVLHAGYNPRPGTLKARLCVEGNQRIREFCARRSVPLASGGILVVAGRDTERSALEDLLVRGRESGVPGLRLVDAGELRRLEPEARGVAALAAPTGASLDAVAYVEAMAQDAQDHGVALRLGAEVRAIEERGSGFELRAGPETIRCRLVVNCAGVYADRLAHAMGAGRRYRIVPIRGEYRRLRPAYRGLVRSMVYPVPDLRFPFLGVHWTRTTSGEVLLGPNAVPALGREAGSWARSSLRGALELASNTHAWRMLAQPGMTRMMSRQLQSSLSDRRFVAEARALVPALRPDMVEPGPAGIRAQLVDESGELVEDLVVEERGNALHVLNVVSPGLTCSMAFAEYLAHRIRG